MCVRFRKCRFVAAKRCPMLGSSRYPRTITDLLNNQPKTRSTQNIVTLKFHTKYTTVLSVKIHNLQSEKYKYA